MPKNLSRNNRVLKLLVTPVKSSLYLYLLLLNIVSNCGDLVYDQSAFAIFSMVALAALLAYVEAAMYKLLVWKWARLLFLLLVFVFHNTLIAIDYFLTYHFHMAIGQDVVDILAETNPVEAANFWDTYLSFPVLVLWIVILVALNLLLVFIARLISRLPYLCIAMCCTVSGLCVMALCIYNFKVYHNGMSIPQYQTTTRLAYSLYIMHQRMQKIESLKVVCSKVKAESTVSDRPTVVVIIGESFCVYHSSLYGYGKPTNPLLQQRREDKSLRLYDNVVSVACATHGAMTSVFSLDSLGVGFGMHPLFPACFKAAGYRTVMYDNQYFVGSGVNFLADAELSKIMFDKRNTERYTYDLQMVESIQPGDTPTLYVIHLWGQHYAYSQRYPQSFQHFNASDYEQKCWTEKQREVIAHYDNATRYNDYVINEIIKKFENKNCCVVYFSDHGEEVYDLSSYMGHGNAEHSSDLSYQIRVPLMVWTSPTFSRPELCDVLDSAKHLPIMTDDISHFLLDMAGISTSSFVASRSFIRQQYNKDKPRIVLHSIDYDKRMKP